jgi:hypothetical protein
VKVSCVCEVFCAWSFLRNVLLMSIFLRGTDVFIDEISRADFVVFSVLYKNACWTNYPADIAWEIRFWGARSECFWHAYTAL